MLVDRELHEHETYFRHSDGVVNLAAGDPSREYVLEPPNTNQILIVPSLAVTIAGKDLLKHYDQFGKQPGSLTVEQWVTDALGVRWDLLSMHGERLTSNEDWLPGTFTGTATRHEYAEPGEQFDLGRVGPSYRTKDHFWDIVEIVPVGLPTGIASNGLIMWKSRLMAMRGMRLAHVSWEVLDALDKSRDGQRKYRIDVHFLRRMPPLDRQYSLTHYAGGAAPVDPVVLAPPAAYNNFGQPDVAAFATQSRSMGAVVEDADSVEVIVYLDVSDPSVGVPTHIEDLLRRPPLLSQLGLYWTLNEHPTAGQPYDVQYGHRRRGSFRSFRDLVDMSTDFARASAANAYAGDDIAFLNIPIRARLRGRNGDSLHARFDGIGNSGLTLLELRAVGGTIAYERGAP